MSANSLAQKKCMWTCLIAASLLFTLRCFMVISYYQEQGVYDGVAPCICPYWNGGLGNQMFEYASLYGISKVKELPLIIAHNDTIAKVFFNIPRLDNTSKIRKRCSKAIIVREKQACAFGMHSYAFNRSSVVLHKSYLQSWKYFQLEEPDLRKQFVFEPVIQKQAQTIIDNEVKHYKNRTGISNDLQIIGVHIRRGDYLLKQKRKYGYQVASTDYIESAMEYFRTKYKQHTLFLVFTAPDKESLQWREHNVNESDVVNMLPHSREVDMSSLSKCNHTIITVGSFGWWSAWLNRGTTIYYKNVAKKDSLLRNAFSGDMSDYFYPGWIGM